MAVKDLELVLTRHLCACLSTPTFLVNAGGTLVHFNEAAEAVLGRRFEETGELSQPQWASAFSPTDEAGRPLEPADLPLVEALATRRPAHRFLRIRGMDGVDRCIEVSAIPLVGVEGLLLGALALFWEEVAPCA